SLRHGPATGQPPARQHATTRSAWRSRCFRVSAEETRAYTATCCGRAPCARGGTSTITVPDGTCWAGSSPRCHLRHAVSELMPRWLASAHSFMPTREHKAGYLPNIRQCLIADVYKSLL